MLSEQNIECGSETVKIHKKCILQADFGKFVLFEAFGQPPSWRKVIAIVCSVTRGK